MFTIPNNAITTTVHGDSNQQSLYTIPFSMTKPSKQLTRGTTLVVLGRDMSAEWLDVVVVDDQLLTHGWIQTSVTRNLMADGRILAPQALPVSDYAYNTHREVYDASRFQKSLRGVAGIKVYGIALLGFTLISLVIGGVIGILFLQGDSVGDKFILGIGFGAIVGFGLGWIPAFIPMARNKKFKELDGYYKALNQVHRKHTGDPIRLESQMDLERAIATAMRQVKS